MNSLLESFAASNPTLGIGARPSFEGASARQCGAERVLFAGGQLASYVIPTSIVPLEFVFRRLPIDGVFTASPRRPCQFEMGSLTVPENMGFVLLDYNFNIYRPSGSAVGDFVPLEENSLATQVGWDLQADGRRQGNYRYEVNPIPPSPDSSSPPSNATGFFPPGAPVIAPDSAFEAARFTQAASPIGDALSLMPQRHHRPGILRVPAPWSLHSSSSLTGSCRVMRAIPIPIAFFELGIFGFLIPDTDLIEMQKTVTPCLLPPGGV